MAGSLADLVGAVSDKTSDLIQRFAYHSSFLAVFRPVLVVAPSMSNGLIAGLAVIARLGKVAYLGVIIWVLAMVPKRMRFSIRRARVAVSFMPLVEAMYRRISA